MGCRSASLNGWPGTQGTSVLPDEMPVQQLGFRLARVKGFCISANDNGNGDAA